MLKSDIETKQCKNCQTTLDKMDKFCSKCGQRDLATPLRFKEVTKAFFSAFLNLDSSIWRTLKDILIPGKLVQRYLSGHRKQYLNPIRLFLFMNIVLLLLITFATKSQFSGEGRKSLGEYAKSNTFKEDLMATYPGGESFDTILKYFDEKGYIIIDSTERATKELKLDSFSMEGINFDVLNIWETEHGNQELGKIDYRDIELMQSDSFERIYSKYGLKDNFLQKHIVKQVIRGAHNNKALVKYLLSHGTWLYFIFIPIMALVMRLFYWRFSLTEHFITLLYLSSYSLLLGILALFVRVCEIDVPHYLQLVLLFWMHIYFMWSYNRISGESLWKTLAKFVVITCLQIVVFVFSMLIIFLFSFLFF